MMAELLLRALLYVFTALTTWLCLERCFGRERPLIAVFGAYLVCYGALFGISLLGSAVLDFAAFSLTSAALVRFCHRRDAKTTALCAAVLTAAMLFSEAAVWGVFALFVPPADGALYAAALDSTSRLLYFLLAFAAAHIFSPRAEAHGSAQTSRLFVVLPSVCIVVSAVSVFFGFGGDTNGTGGTMTVLFILSLLFLNILLLIQHERMRRTRPPTQHPAGDLRPQLLPHPSGKIQRPADTCPRHKEPLPSNRGSRGGEQGRRGREVYLRA